MIVLHGEWTLRLLLSSSVTPRPPTRDCHNTQRVLSPPHTHTTDTHPLLATPADRLCRSVYNGLLFIARPCPLLSLS